MFPPSLYGASFIISSRSELDVMAPCKNLCDRLAYPCFASPSPYALGLKYCTRCAKYFDIDAIRCPCCNRRLRYKRGKNGPRKKDYDVGLMFWWVNFGGSDLSGPIMIVLCTYAIRMLSYSRMKAIFCWYCWQVRTEPDILIKKGVGWQMDTTWLKAIFSMSLAGIG